MYLLGYDIGSSSVKASLVNSETGKCVASAFYPKTEAEIIAVHPGWAEQKPEMWWANLKLATEAVMNESGVRKEDIAAIGISYQMHGLVCVDKNQQVLRPAIIWCDSRAVPYGRRLSIRWVKSCVFLICLTLRVILPLPSLPGLKRMNRMSMPE